MQATAIMRPFKKAAVSLGLNISTNYTSKIYQYMNAAELKDLQTHIKEKYKEQPDSALITLKAQGNIGEGISCKVDTGRALVNAGLHPATGGDGMLACSGDMLLEALVACAGVTLKAVATAIGVELKSGIVMPKATLTLEEHWAYQKKHR
jgi:hypothetical protein